MSLLLDLRIFLDICPVNIFLSLCFKRPKEESETIMKYIVVNQGFSIYARAVLITRGMGKSGAIS